ncbi:hypothetical protein FDT66_06065, partial [Polaribacter aestuariivivens]
MKKKFFKVLEFGEILQTNKKISKGLVFSFTLLLFISFQSFAQNPITSATTILQPATPSTYTEGGQLYEWGQGNNIILDKIVFNGEEFFLDNTFSQTNYSIVRVNGNGGISYERFGIFAQENTGNFNYAPSLPGSFGSYSMEDLLDEPIINRGANDVFKNATSTAQNIERIDVTYVPFKVPNLPNLDKVGFIASEKDGNSSYKAAAITSVDALGNPLTFGPVITIQNGDYGIITGDLDFDILANNTEGGNPIRITDNVQSVGITIITLSDLGIGINDIVYGISFFDDNVADDADLLDVASFPNLNGGGADIFGGLGAIATSIGTVSGNVYLDINGNGTKDSNEPGLKNITVSILGSDGGYQTVVTDSNGNYTGFVPGGNTTITINENDPDLPPNFTRSEGSNPKVISAIEGQDVNIGNIGYTSDNDNDGVIDLNDVDDDNDGILDTEELTIGAITYNPLGDEDGDKIVNYLDTSDDGTGDGSTTNYTTTGTGGIPDVYDFDDDGIPNHLDLDSDNDGIPDNIEAQTTNDYIAPSGAVGSGFTDVDGDGLDDNYDPIVSGGTSGTAITPVNSDSATVTDNPDYLDLDSDEDDVSDTIEANLTLSGNVGENGLDNFYDNGDGYTDVNGSFDNTQTDNFPDDGNNASNGLPDDVNWRDSAVLGQLDRDNDGIPDITDIDDDNDGILDSDECQNTTIPAGAIPTNAVDAITFNSDVDVQDRILTNDNDGAEFNTTNSVLVVAFGQSLPVGTTVIFEADRDGDGTTDFATFRIQQANTADGSDASNPLVISSLTTSFVEYTYTITGTSATHLRISLDDIESGGEAEVDHVRWNSFTGCLDVDTDGDGIINRLDLDSDNDGIPDNIEGQGTATYVAPTSGVGANGLYDVYENNDTSGATSYTVENTDGTDNPDYIDLDSDNDDTSDRIEANISLNGSVGLNGLDSNQENADNYIDTNGSYGNTPYDDFPNTNAADSPDEVDWRDATTQFIDTDNDGVPDATDLDDDNDGILDTIEDNSGGTCPPEYNATLESESGVTNPGNITGAPDGNTAEINTNGNVFVLDFGQEYPAGTQYQITWRRNAGSGTAIMVLSESTDDATYTAHPSPPENSDDVNFEDEIVTSNVAFRYIRITKDDPPSIVDFEIDAIGVIPSTCILDTDNDGIPNYLDLDSDNDGIPDNIEAQTTQGYSAPDGVFDIFGVDTAYTEGLTPVDTDLDGTPDYLETDSDNDGFLDNVEADLTLTGVYGINGLDNAYDNGDNYIDVNGSFDDSQTDNFPDQDADVFNGGDVDYRDAIFDIDVDQDGISNAIDLDDDNDGILDTDEGRRTLLANSGFNNFTAPTFGDNVGLSITPWILESGTNTNVVKVDGAGGSTYGNGGPEFDATGVAGNYFTINGSDGVLYQTFTLTETTIVDYGGFISARNGNTATGKLSIYSGTGSGGTELSSTGPKVASSSSIWLKIGNSVTLPAGTYSLVADLEEDINFDEAFAFSNIDSDGDGIPNHFDLDADNDGIPDNIEAQTTAGYIAPSGSYSLSGIDLAYGTGLTPVNTDGTDLPDYLDLDSDNEGGFDIVESGAGLTDANTDGVADGAPSAFGINGLINTLETGDTDLGYTDVNGEYDNTFTSVFTDTDGDVNSGGDLDYRDNIVGVDSDGDGIVNSIDIDDDNDGIPDVNEDSQIISFVTSSDAYWPLDGNTDDAINSNDERANGAAPSYSTDAIQGTNSADFNGTTNTIRYSQDGTFMESSYTEISFSAWIKPDVVTGQRIIYEEGGSTHGATLWIDNGVLTFSTRNGSNQRNITHPTSLTVDGEWHHVAATFSSGILTVYLDGVPSSIDVSADYTTIPGHGSDGGLGGPIGGGTSGNISGFYDGLMDAVRYSNTTTFSSADVLTEATKINNSDFDGDGIINSLDIDADNDGIPDNVEAQTTLGYVTPSGVDTDNDGLDDAYDTDCTPCGGITGVDLSVTNNNDGTDNPDFVDLDSDNDGTPDIQENGDSDNSVSGTDSDNDGLDDNFEGADVNDGYDVNDEINTPSTDLPDTDSDVATDDVDYRDLDDDVVTPGDLGNVLWLRADIDVTGTTDVTSWVDQSSNGFTATGDSGVEPTKIDAGLNFNPTIDFNGTNDRMRILGGIFGVETYTNLWTYYVINPTTATTNYIAYENAATDNYITGIIAGDLNQQIGTPASSHSETIPSLTGEFGLYTLGSSNSGGTTPFGFNQAISKNGLLIGTQNQSISFTGTNDNFDLGSFNNSSDFFNGELAEIIIVNETPTSLKQQQIESYLAIKYGITLDATDNDPDIVEGDYILADQNTKIWNYTTCANYSNDIAGIGRDDAMALGQYQSKSINNDAIITIGLTAIATSNKNNTNYPSGTITDTNPPGAGFESNKDFLVWGNNNESLLEADVTETELICAPEKTLARIWKAKETGSVGTTQIAVDKTTIDNALTTENTVKVFKVADNDSFTSNVEYIPLTIGSGDLAGLYLVDYDFEGVKYFTYSEINGIFWNGDAGVSGSWIGGNSTLTGVNLNGPSRNAADRDKVMVIDAQTSLTNAVLPEDARVECVWIKENSKLIIPDNMYLEFDEDFILDGEMRLVGDGQLVQTHVGLSNVEGTGKLY